jgi:hypothetical protein
LRIQPGSALCALSVAHDRNGCLAYVIFRIVWSVVGPAGGDPFLLAGRAKDTSTPPRSSRWAVEKPTVKRAHCDPADGRVAVSLPIKRAAAIRAEMESNAIATVSVALVDLPLAVKSHLLFRICGAEMEGGAGATLARLAVAQVNPIGITGGNNAKRAAMALLGSVHLVSSHFLVCVSLWSIFLAAVEPRRTEGA